MKGSSPEEITQRALLETGGSGEALYGTNPFPFLLNFGVESSAVK